MSDKPKNAQDMAKRLMLQIDEAGLSRNYKGSEVKTILNTISQCRPNDVANDSCRAPVEVRDIRRGDVFISNTFGGKPRPWIVLRRDVDTVSALAMSSGETAPGLVQSKCRFWPGSWVSTAIVQFDIDYAAREVTRPYTNSRHLDEVEAAIVQRLTKKPDVSIASIRAKIRGAAA